MSFFNYEDSAATLLEVHGLRVVEYAIKRRFDARTISSMCEMSLTHALDMGNWDKEERWRSGARRDTDVFLASHEWLMNPVISYFGRWSKEQSMEVARHLHMLQGMIIPDATRKWAIAHLGNSMHRYEPPRLGEIEIGDDHIMERLYSRSGVGWWRLFT